LYKNQLTDRKDYTLCGERVSSDEAQESNNSDERTRERQTETDRQT